MKKVHLLLNPSPVGKNQGFFPTGQNNEVVLSANPCPPRGGARFPHGGRRAATGGDLDLKLYKQIKISFKRKKNHVRVFLSKKRGHVPL